MTYTLGEVFATINPRLELRGVNDNNGEPIRTVSLEATPTEGYLELPKGDPGATGSPGPTQPVVKWQGAINTEAALPSGLGGGQAGWAWGNTANGDVFIWLGDTWLRLPHALTVVGPLLPTSVDHAGEKYSPAALFDCDRGTQCARNRSR